MVVVVEGGGRGGTVFGMKAVVHLRLQEKGNSWNWKVADSSLNFDLRACTNEVHTHTE
jgi:hypothetical protein